MPNKRIEFTEPLLLEKPAPTFAPDAPIMRFTDALMTAGWQVYHRYTDRAVVGFCSLNGAAHYKYLLEASLLAHSNDTVIDAWRYRPDGTLDAHESIPYPTEAGAEYKAESGVLWLGLEGVNLVVYDGFHLAVTTEARPSVTAIYSVAGFVVDPYPQGVAPMGTSFNLAGLPGAGGGGEPTPSEPVDYTRVQQAVVAALVQVLGATDGTQVFNRVVDAGRRGVQLANLHDGNLAATTLYNRISETAYESACNALKDAGLWHGATTASATTGETNTNATETGHNDSGDAQP